MLNGEVKTIQLESPSVVQCISDLPAVEAVLTRIGADVLGVRCVIEASR